MPSDTRAAAGADTDVQAEHARIGGVRVDDQTPTHQVDLANPYTVTLAGDTPAAPGAEPKKRRWPAALTPDPRFVVAALLAGAVTLAAAALSIAIMLHLAIQAQQGNAGLFWH